jgi:hypothetical protein
MRTFISVAALLCLTTALHAESEGRLIFSDQFNRDEATPDKEDIGNGWTTNSAWRAPGKKQVDLKNGALHGGTHPEAGHALVLFHPAGLRDGAVEFKFMIEEGESLGVEFADPECKTVHAGHLCMVRVGRGQLTISDLKTGNMDLKIRERRSAGDKSPELSALLKSKSKSFPIEIKPAQWHTLRFTVRDATLTAFVDGREIGSFSSEGISHPLKHEIRINIGKSAAIDDVSIWTFD